MKHHGRVDLHSVYFPYSYSLSQRSNGEKWLDKELQFLGNIKRNEITETDRSKGKAEKLATTPPYGLSAKNYGIILSHFLVRVCDRRLT